MSTSATPPGGATARERDAQIKRDVLQELDWDPRVQATDVGVLVHAGIVSLTGRVTSYARKLAAQEAAHRVRGVHDVANEIEVVAPCHDETSDEEIAAAVRNALIWDELVSDESIDSTVTDGWVTLTGTVDTLAERDEATRAAQRLKGVVGVSNDVSVKERTFDREWVRRSIEEALDRQAHLEAEHLRIDVRPGGIIRIAGKVRSRADRRVILRTASCAPGVRAVQERLEVE